MRTERAGQPALALAVALFAGCIGAADPAPEGWRRSRDEVPSSPHGAWIQIGTHAGRVVNGELLSVEEDEIVIAERRGPERVPLARVRDATLSIYDQGAVRGGVWTTLGTLTTGTHGLWLVFSLPTWVITGAISARADSKGGFRTYEEGDGLKKLRKWRRWARFPQGMPEGLRAVRPGKGAE